MADIEEKVSGSSYPQYRKARKLEKENRLWSITVIRSELSQSEADSLEKLLIERYKKTILNILPGGGINRTGIKVPDHVRQKMSLAAKGKPKSEAHKLALRKPKKTNPKRGVPLSEAHKQALRKPKSKKREYTSKQVKRQGIKTVSDELKQRISETMKLKVDDAQRERMRDINIGRKWSSDINDKKGRKGKENPLSKHYSLTSPNGELFDIYGLSRDFCSQHGITQSGISQAIRNGNSKYKGWIVEEIKEDNA